MLSLLVLILLFIYMYKKRSSYNPYDVKYSHSSYYDCSFTKRETCTEEILDILRPVAGYKRILTDLCLTDELGRTGGADVVMIHESGIYVIYSGNFPGVISGNPEGRYWIQSFREGWFLSCRNYLYNPFLEISGFWTGCSGSLKTCPGFLIIPLRFSERRVCWLRPDIWEKTVSPCLFMGFLRLWRIYSAITDGF